MEILFLILLLALFGMFVSNARLKERVTVLEQRLDGLAGGVRIQPLAEEHDLVAQPAVLREAEAVAMRSPAAAGPAMQPEAASARVIEFTDEPEVEAPRETV